MERPLARYAISTTSPFISPLFLKQLLTRDQSQVTFVGQIRSISTQPTNITYKIDDGTGLIEAKQWIDVNSADDTSSQMDLDSSKSKLVEDGYCRVWGRLK